LGEEPVGICRVYSVPAALLAALVESSVLPYLLIAGVKPDLVFMLAVLTAMVLGVEDGLIWAFLGGLLLDMLIPGRVTGATAVALLISVGLAIAISRLFSQSRVVAPVVAIVALTFVYQLVVLALLVATSDVHLLESPWTAIARTAVLNGVLGLVFAAIGRTLWVRYRQTDRLAW